MTTEEVEGAEECGEDEARCSRKSKALDRVRHDCVLVVPSLPTSSPEIGFRKRRVMRGAAAASTFTPA
jgi:hypothetical protein